MIIITLKNQKKMLQYLKGQLRNINKKIKTEQQKNRRLITKFKRIKEEILDLKKNNPAINIPMNMLVKIFFIKVFFRFIGVKYLIK